MSDKWTGSHRYCGGEKSLNNLVLLLRRHGYEAWLVTLDGKQAGWLAEQAPCLSIAEFQRHQEPGRPVRCVTSWLEAHVFLDACGPFYYWGPRACDYGGTSVSHALGLFEIRPGSKSSPASIVPSEPGCRAHFDVPASLVRSLVDENLWKPDPAKRHPNRVGYVAESADTPALIEGIRAHAKARGLQLDFQEMSGDEPDMVAQMQACSVFIVTNPGKSDLWGEGGPLGPHESAACGAVPICFDLDGPREIIQSGYNGVIVPRHRADLMAAVVAELFENPTRLDEMKGRARETILASHAMETRWAEVADFLDLPVR